MNYFQCSQVRNINEFNNEFDLENEESVILPETIEERKIAAANYKANKNSGEFGNLQEQLCATIPNVGLRNKLFRYYFVTPFGEVCLSFKYLPKSKRYIRFAVNAGTYNDLTKKLDSKYPNSEERIKIYNAILNYLTLKPSNNAWSNQYSSENKNYKNNEYYKYDKDLAYFFAILAVCDPCYGEGENGGKDIRVILRSNECKLGCEFKKFLDPHFYPLSQKGAYAIYRYYSNECPNKQFKKSLKGTKRTINCMSSSFSPRKSKPIKKPNSSSKIFPGVIF